MNKLWHHAHLMAQANTIVATWFRRYASKGENSLFWLFYFEWTKISSDLVKDFIQGKYRPEPLRKYCFTDDCLLVWTYTDRLIIRLILTIIKPTFKYVISPLCLHLKGPDGVKHAIDQVQKALNTNDYHYFIRADIKGYYANIDHQILLDQLFEQYQDPKVRYYFSAFVTALTDDDGILRHSNKGIPRRSSISPFFGALYLSPLDRAFEKQKGIFYVRYMDDIVILAKTRRQYLNAKKKLHLHLKALKLSLSQHKTKMGKCVTAQHNTQHSQINTENNTNNNPFGDDASVFHFLGVNFLVAQTPESKKPWATGVHPRTCRRALDKVIALNTDAVHPAIIQQYLIRWARWWVRTSCRQINICTMLRAWTAYASRHSPQHAWVGRGLLIAWPLPPHAEA